MIDSDVQNKVKDTTAQLAKRGYRALGVAESKDEGKTWIVLGVLSMFDPPRDDSKKTIEECKREGISVKMITGDDTAIAIETAKKLGMGTKIYNASQVFPEHKYAIVKTLQKQGYIVTVSTTPQL
ncbi:HAD-IC family P-type ATPase [Lactobacillus helveticus]|uniref:HAD-IC family P-type ATPase n=1 Tax=Lactobacillus helveticus TaxID=1587 RepID=UPI0027DD0AC7|nr:HAD-IC family P-type ATPase [Lactobacillus helveticus]